MILKVASCVEGGQNWVFIGDVAEVLTGKAFLREHGFSKEVVHQVGIYVDPAPPQALVGKETIDVPTQYDRVFLPCYLNDRIFRKKEPFVKVSTALLSLRNGAHMSVVFWEAYLLNDEGKTIERL